MLIACFFLVYFIGFFFFFNFSVSFFFKWREVDKRYSHIKSSTSSTTIIVFFLDFLLLISILVFFFFRFFLFILCFFSFFKSLLVCFFFLRFLYQCFCKKNFGVYKKVFFVNFFFVNRGGVFIMMWDLCNAIDLMHFIFWVHLVKLHFRI